jgi:hypothetical protein
MRYLKRQNLNRRVANDTTLYSDVANANVYVAPTGAGSLVIPVGTTAQRPGSPTNGMLRYNTDITTNGEVEIYQSGKWRSLRFREATQIIQQNLGAGDGATTVFGPLNSTYYNPSNISSDVASFGGQNILVVVENVIQLSTTNYTVVQNPSVAGETYVGTLSAAATSGSTTLYFSTSLVATSASSGGSVSFIGFISNGSGPSTIIGTTLTVTGGTGTPLLGMTLSGTNITGSPTVTAVNSAAFTGYISGTTLTVTAITSSALALGLVITGSTTSAGTYITAFGTGIGGTGNYTVNNSQTVGSSGSPVNLTGTSYTVSSTQLTASETITGTGVTATLGFATQSAPPFAVGDSITVAGMNPVGYNGKYTVTASTASSVSYACTAVGSMITGGTITSATAVYPAINIVGATVTNSANLYSPTTILSVNTDPITDALISVTLSHATITGTIPAGASIILTEATTSGTGYYLSFTSPVPYGKTVTALLGFDQ